VYYIFITIQPSSLPTYQLLAIALKPSATCQLTPILEHIPPHHHDASLQPKHLPCLRRPPTSRRRSTKPKRTINTVFVNAVLNGWRRPSTSRRRLINHIPISVGLTFYSLMILTNAEQTISPVLHTPGRSDPITLSTIFERRRISMTDSHTNNSSRTLLGFGSVPPSRASLSS
jgi:hypothetical protein